MNAEPLIKFLYIFFCFQLYLPPVHFLHCSQVCLFTKNITFLSLISYITLLSRWNYKFFMFTISWIIWFPRIFPISYLTTPSTLTSIWTYIDSFKFLNASCWFPLWGTFFLSSAICLDVNVYKVYLNTWSMISFAYKIFLTI